MEVEKFEVAQTTQTTVSTGQCSSGGISISSIALGVVLTLVVGLLVTHWQAISGWVARRMEEHKGKADLKALRQSWKRGTEELPAPDEGTRKATVTGDNHTDVDGLEGLDNVVIS